MNNFLLALKAYRSNVEIHKHSAYQIVVTNDEPFMTTINQQQYSSIYGFAIKPHIPHSCQCSNSTLTILNIEPYSEMGNYLNLRFNDHKHPVVFSSIQQRNNFFNSSGDEFDIREFLEDALQLTIHRQIDERVNRMVTYINDNYSSEKFSLNQLSDIIFLSVSRMSYLFKMQTGSSIFKYLLWIRLRNAVSIILSKNSKSLTEIACETGFYDSAQLNKYMYQMFGISPSKLKQKSDLIQFLH